MRRLLLFFIFQLFFFVLIQDTLAAPSSPVTVRIAAFNFYPTIFQAKDGSVQGFYVDFLNEIASREGWNIEYVYGNWADGLDRIKSGEVDVLTNVAFNMERAAFLDYGKVPLLTVWSELYVPVGSAIASIGEVKGKKIGVMKGDYNGNNFRNLVEKLEISCEIVEYGNFEEIFKAIFSKQVDGGVVNNTFGAAKQNEYNITSSGVVFNPFDIFFTVAKGHNQQILATLDKYLEEWRKEKNSPFHEARERWSHGTASTISVVPPAVKRILFIFILLITAAVVFLALLRIQVRRKTKELNEQLAERRKIEETLYLVNESGAALRGEELLASITSQLAKALEADYAFVGQLLPGNERVRSSGFFVDGIRIPDVEYNLKNTPCGNVVGGTFCFYADNIKEQFPDDKLLVDMEAEGYAATPLWDSTGAAIGLMGIISKSPLCNQRLIETILQIFATRAAQELDAINRLNELELKNFTIENIQDAVYWISSEGTFLDVNNTAIAMLGYTRNEFLSMKVADLDPFFPAEKWQQQWAYIKEVGSNSFEAIHRAKDGRDIPVEITAMHYEFKEFDFHCAVARDITERKQKEAALREKEERLRFFFEYAPASLAMFDREMRYIYASNRWRSDYGLTEINLAGLSHYEVFPEIPEQWKEAHRCGMAGKTLREEAEQFVRADGSVQWLCWEIRPWYDAEEKIGGILIFTEDITEKRMVEDALGARERFLRTMTDNLPGLVAYWTNELRCTFANRSYLEWFGRTPEQMIGITIQELLGEDNFKKNEYHINGVLQGKPQHFERTLIKPTGETGNTWAQYIPDVVDGTVQGFYVLISDVTELKHAEEEKGKLEVQLQQAQKMESVGRLAGGVAHDFNNLLTVILGYTQLSIMELDPAHPVYAHLEGIRKAADRSADLTHQLLAFARKQTIAPKVLDLNVTVEHVLKMLRRLIGEAIHLAWQPASNLWQVKIDPSQIDQILANLCVNARDAIGDIGKITIETGHCTFDEEYCATHLGFIPGEFVLLAVSDDGCGMDKDTMSHVFEPFFTTKGLGEGTGLGLAMVYGIVKQNNGFINIYSEPNHGTTFKIYLPRHEGTDSRIPVEGAIKPISRGKESILLVEDEANILKITTVLLEKLGYKVFPAKTPGEAIDLAKQHVDEIDMLMTDVVMPEMNGRDLSKKLLKICPKIKCLYMSGYTANVIAHHGVLDENIYFISKPFSLPALASKVRDVLDTQSSGIQDSFE